MRNSPRPRPSLRRAAIVGSVATVIAVLTACTATVSNEATESSTTTAVVTTGTSFWDSTTVHDIAVVVDPEDYDALIAAYIADGEKQWTEATVTIDGAVFENVGLKLKGNSSVFGVTADTDPATVPWLIRLDKFVDGQSFAGETDLVIRSNNTETALNEAVSLDLLELAGLATEQAVASRFSVNGGAAELRLVVQLPNDQWQLEQFGNDGLVYKAEAGGDYSYRGDDAASYDEIFDQEVGDDDLEPLTEFLKFINEADDVTFAGSLADYLDVEEFATYLAFQDLVDNYDDISGPGNNSYLQYNEQTGLMTVASWDMNLTFGVTNRPGGAGAAGGMPQGGMPAGGMPTNGQRPGGQGGAAGGGPSASNVLADRFLETDEFAALYDEATATLTTTIFASGDAQAVLDGWVAVLTEHAGDLVDTATVSNDADSIAAYFD